MGFIINADLETSQGPTQELYLRVEGFSFNKVTAELGFQITYWIDREHAIKHNRVYLEQEVRPMVGLVQNKMMYYEQADYDGEEVEFKHYLKVNVAEEREIEIPIFEMQEVTEEVPYISFDENGDEVVKHRKIIKEKKVETGTYKEVKSVIDTKAFDDIYGYCYRRLYEHLIDIVPKDKIETVK